MSNVLVLNLTYQDHKFEYEVEEYEEYFAHQNT